jgi:hypothetical protein
MVQSFNNQRLSRPDFESILKPVATPVLIPVSEYLNTTYRPDRDYVDGELKERNLGEKPHGLLQGILYIMFQNNRREWGLERISRRYTG